MIKVKRVYEPPEADDGSRFLVDRIWPRGLKKAELRLDGWLKELAPSRELRRWFGHDPARWDEFQRRYATELGDHPDDVRMLLDASLHGTVSLLYGARDTEHNNAVALKSYLDAQLD